jgi:hypothetical protein
MSSNVPDHCQQQAINWAKSHVMRFGDTDIFPVPFEYECLNSHWNVVLPWLQSIDLSQHEVRTALRLMVPKHTDGFRASTQLDPIDCLLFTASVFEGASQIEGFRAPKSNKVACSYRLNIDANGGLFQSDNGWSDFHVQSRSLASKARSKAVVVADIADFYNHASHHRIQNQLQAAGVDELRTRSIERFLSNLNARHHSRGIPVGPSVSILLAELCLADVDSFLERTGCKHTRYVDDFRVFCKSQQHGTKILHDLTEYLHTAHRLSLQGGKTRILDCTRFCEEELRDPEEMEQTEFQSEIEEVLETIRNARYGEGSDESSISDSEKTKAGRNALRSVFQEIITQSPLPLGSARYVLRRATQLKTRVIFRDVIENLESLLPVLRDVVLYLVKACYSGHESEVGDRLKTLALKSDFQDVPFVKLWTIEAICKRPGFSTGKIAMEIADKADVALRDRLLALVARRYNIVDWVRSRKENWQNSSAWGQRAIVWASSILPQDERGHWLKPIASYPDMLIQAVAKSVP